MAKHRMEDGTVVDTDRARLTFSNATDWDGRNHINRSTRDQWTGQTLYCSRKGRYYILHWSQWQGSRDHAEWVSPQEAARWLAFNECDLPADLEALAEEVCE